MMFGLDQGNFGNVQTYESFRSHWCEGKYGDVTTCHSPGVNQNHEWLEGFIIWADTLITLGAAAGALTLAPIITRKLGRRPKGGFLVNFEKVKYGFFGNLEKSLQWRPLT